MLCSSCGKKISTIFADSNLAAVHGQRQCRECFAKEHPECTTCKELTEKLWKYCAHCGGKLK